MPFDDTEAKKQASVKNKAEIAILDRLEALFFDPKNWCQGAYKRTTFNVVRKWWYIFPGIVPHTAFCMIGGLAYLTHQDAKEVGRGRGPHVIRRVRQRLRKMAEESIPDYNDSHDHADILDLIKRARESFLAEANA